MTQKKLDTGHTCPVCGYELNFKAWDNGYDSQEICPSCGTQFGYNDFGTSKEEIISKWRTLRKNWIERGMKFKHPSSMLKLPSNDWNPSEQLKNIPKEFM